MDRASVGGAGADMATTTATTITSLLPNSLNLNTLQDPAQDILQNLLDSLPDLPNQDPHQAVLRVLPFVPRNIVSVEPNGSHGLPGSRIEPHLHLTATTTEGSSQAILKRAYERLCRSGTEMEDLLVREHQTEQHVRDLMSRGDADLNELLEAFNQYRRICEAHILAVFATPEANKVSEKLWNLHVEGKGFFKKNVAKLEKHGASNTVEARKLKMLFLYFIKAATRFYREYIWKLNVKFSGIPELEAAAHLVKTDSIGESQQAVISPEARQSVLFACHQSLIYLGDLARYRAAEQLDRKQDYGPALGYYELAAVICHTKGHAHHQASMVALSQERFTQATYHLYRSIVVVEPHPLAGKNLTMAFAKIDRLWARQELIKRNTVGDGDSLKKKLLGLFLRLHSLCHTGRDFHAYEESEKTIHAHLSTELKARDIGGNLHRLVVINIAAQHLISEHFQVNPTPELSKAYFYMLRFNITTFTALLKLFGNDLRFTLTQIGNVDELDLTAKLGTVMSRVLPAVRIYSSWLLKNSHIVCQLATDSFLAISINALWAVYAETLDLVTASFPIWDLEDVPEVTYMLDEDVKTLGMLPLDDVKTAKVWMDTSTGGMKAKFSDFGVQRVSIQEENLARIKDFLIDGLYLANDIEETPIGLKGTRIYYGEAPEDPAPFVPTAKRTVLEAGQINGQPAQAAKPLSYAAAATQKKATPGVHARTNGQNAPRQPAQRDESRLEDMSRMVNELVGEEDDDDDPVTPPQKYIVTPAIANASGTANTGSSHNSKDANKMPPPPPNYGYQSKGPVSAMNAFSATPKNRTSNSDRNSASWQGSPFGVSSGFPSDIPKGTMTPPAARKGHSRVNSATSVRSRTSQGDSPIFSSMDLPLPQPRKTPGAGPLVNGYSFNTPVASPLLFGASNTMWSNGSRGQFGGNLRKSFGEATGSPPNGQGG